MDRRSFFLSSAFTLPLISAAALLPAADNFEVPNADPEAWFWFPGHNFCMKATGADTGGTSAYMLADSAPRQGTPFHKHKNEDESFLVVEGTFEITVGNKTVVGGPGTYAFGPRNISHRWTNVGSGRGRIANIFTPSGFEASFYEIAVPIDNAAAPPPVDPSPLVARMPKLMKKYGSVRTGDFKYPVAGV